MTVADELLADVPETPLITGAVVSAMVVKLKSPEIAKLAAASLDFTRKWYVVLAVRPPSPWECDVTRAALSAVAKPYPVVVPYSTWPSLASSVVQVTVADAVLADVPETPLITGAVVSAA